MIGWYFSEITHHKQSLLGWNERERNWEEGIFRLDTAGICYSRRRRRRLWVEKYMGMYRKNRACRVSYGHVVKARKVMRSDPSSIPMWRVRAKVRLLFQDVPLNIINPTTFHAPAKYNMNSWITAHVVTVPCLKLHFSTKKNICNIFHLWGRKKIREKEKGSFGFFNVGERSGGEMGVAGCRSSPMNKGYVVAMKTS